MTAVCKAVSSSAPTQPHWSHETKQRRPFREAANLLQATSTQLTYPKKKVFIERDFWPKNAQLNNAKSMKEIKMESLRENEMWHGEKNEREERTSNKKGVCGNLLRH